MVEVLENQDMLQYLQILADPNDRISKQANSSDVGKLKALSQGLAFTSAGAGADSEAQPMTQNFENSFQDI